MSRTKCTMYFVEMSFSDSILACNDTAANCITKNADKNTEELVYDETVDNNLRYIGADPNNYVSFNNELWRIIGVMNNIDDGTGKKETRLKIIRDEPIGEYSWDNKGENGENDWTTASLQTVLNSGAYYNRTSGECPYGQNGATTSCDFTSTGLTEDAKSLINNAVWNLGGSDTFDNVTTAMFYERERGDTVYNERPTEWTGQIGLMYPSDYGYATSGSNTIDRSVCISEYLYNWEELSDCYINDWLYEENLHRWAITQASITSDHVFHVISTGRIGNSYVSYTTISVSPTVYLTYNIQIIEGDGSESNPFVLGL